MVACKEGHADVVKLLCEARVDDTYLNLQNIDGDTALHMLYDVSMKLGTLLD